jgi:uncharacterized protein (TIGR02453 family)
MSDFRAFPHQTRNFLEELGAHNRREWFAAHRDDYERYWLAPAQAFVAAIGPLLASFAPGVHAEPRINGSIMRINRDTRFSRDKTPYKTHLDLWFWEGAERRSAVSGYFVRLTADTFAVGAGAHGFSPARLKAYRAAVVDPDHGGALVKAARRLEAAGLEIGGETYRRQPAGHAAPNEEAARFLRHSALWTVEEVHHAAVAEDGAALDHAMAEFRRMAPLHRWLVDALGETPGGSA